MKHRKKHMSEKLLCMALSLSMIAGSPAPAAFAAETEAIVESQSAVALTCATEPMQLTDNGRSIEAKVCLTQDDGLIQQKIFTEDIVLGGVFRNMIVDDVRNDHKTILLDLVGVPDLSENDGNGALQGTMEFPGLLFGSEGNVTAGINIIRREGTTEKQKPSFHPYLDGLRTDGDNVEMIVVLLPLLGRFTDNFSSEDIAFTDGLSGAKVRTGRKMEDGCYELIIEAPKEAMEEEDGYSCFGGIALREGSMFSPDGTTYGKVLTASRKFSMDTVGRDLTNNDINSIKKIVGGFGNTTAGTVMGVLSGAGTAYTIGSSILGLVGVLPTDSSRHAELMEKLQEIQNSLNQVSEKCDYMSRVLDTHTKMLIDMTRDSNEKYVGTFDSQLDAMVTAMDSLEEGLKDPLIQEEIEEVLLDLCKKYEIPQENAGRDIDEDLVVVDPEYYEYDYEADEAGYAEEAMDFDMLLSTGGLFEEEGEGGTEQPDVI